MKKTLSKTIVFSFIIMNCSLLWPSYSLAQTAFPYTKTFTLTAYYSPLPNQQRYATGSYESDIILNGNGTHGADGTPVYPGMVAAPASYPFSTKMKIPGIGTVAVHDRGGAIIEADGENHTFDRLDIWMGYGDEGLQRALAWGRRSLDITVYGINPQMKEDVVWEGLETGLSSKRESNLGIRDTSTSSKPINLSQRASTTPKSTATQGPNNLVSNFSQTLDIGSKNEDVKRLQKELFQLHLLGVEPTGYYGELTQHAVFKFQQIHGLVADKNSLGAGTFGPKTRQIMNGIIAKRIAITASIRKG